MPKMHKQKIIVSGNNYAPNWQHHNSEISHFRKKALGMVDSNVGIVVFSPFMQSLLGGSPEEQHNRRIMSFYRQVADYEKLIGRQRHSFLFILESDLQFKHMKHVLNDEGIPFYVYITKLVDQQGDNPQLSSFLENHNSLVLMGVRRLIEKAVDPIIRQLYRLGMGSKPITLENELIYPRIFQKNQE